MDELELEAIIAEAETSTNLAWLRRTLVEVAGELRGLVIRRATPEVREQSTPTARPVRSPEVDSARLSV